MKFFVQTGSKGPSSIHIEFTERDNLDNVLYKLTAVKEFLRRKDQKPKEVKK